MSGASREDEEAARAAAEFTRRAIRRLDLLEWVIVMGALAIATVGGGAVAVLIAPPFGLDVRTTWIVTALLLFVVPGAIGIARVKRGEGGRGRDDDGPGPGRARNA